MDTELRFLLTNPEGLRLKTAQKYVEKDIQITPALSTPPVIIPNEEGIEIEPEEGYVGFDSILVAPIPENYKDTSTATATELDIRESKTAFANGEEVVGAIPDYSGAVHGGTGGSKKIIIEVDVLPETLQDGVLYKLWELTGLAISERGAFYANSLGLMLGVNWEYFTVQTRQQITNAKSGSAYYIRDEEIMIVYLDGDTEEIPCKPIYSAKEATETGYYAFYGACSFIERSLDVKIYVCDSGKVEDLTWLQPTIIQSRDEVTVSGFYYVWGEHTFAHYDAGWDVLACTVISNLDEISEDGVYSIETFTKTYNRTNGEMQITERGTYDVTNYKTVAVKDVDIIDVAELPENPNDIVDKFYRKSGELYKWDAEKAVADTDSVIGTWYFNETPELISGEYEINFYAGVTTYYDSPFDEYTRINIYSSGIRYFQPNIQQYFDEYRLEDGWLNEGQRTITIFGGDDVENTSFVEWLKSNATRKGAWVKYVPEA